MTGIEVVGLVLGAVPLVISGLEHYAKGVESIRVIKNAAQEFRAVARKLEGENVVFRNTLSILLNDCVDIEMQKNLMDEVGGEKWWQGSEVRAALEHRLQGSYTSYIDHVRSIAKTLHTFKKKLHVDNDGKVPFDDPKSFRQAYKRLGFALSKSAYLGLVQEIKDDNTHLHRLTEQSHTLQSGRRARRIPDFDQIRASAASIFESLQRGLHFSCGAPHKASICMKRIANESDVGQTQLEDVYRIVLHHEFVLPGQQALQWSVEEAEVRLLDATPLAECGSPATTATSTNFLAKRKVQFHSPFVATTTVKGNSTLSKDTKEIRDLCESIENFRAMQCGTCLGYLMNASSQCRHGFYWPKKRLIDRTALSVQSLGNLFDQQKQSGYKLTNADAHRLAVSLATGMLRLHDTPWLNQDWNKNDISLISHNGKVLAEHPFISQRLTSCVLQGRSSVRNGTASLRIIRNSTLFALGVMLIELCMESSIDGLHEQNELNPDGSKHELSDYYTATRLVDSEVISDRFGKRWSEVVRRCVFCDLNQGKPSLTDVGFRKAVYNEILAELEEDHRQFFNL